MIPDLAEHRDNLIVRLLDISQQTENIYLNLGKRFPDLIGEMESGLTGARDFVSTLENVYSHQEKPAGRMGVFIDQLKETIKNSEKEIAVLQSADRSIMASIDEKVGRLSSLSGYIGSIHLDSEEMEIISLNAMVMGIKAGAAGKAFSYITEELKRLSTRTIGLSEETIRRGQHLLDRFGSFQTMMREAREQQDRFNSEFRARLENSMGDFQAGLERCVARLKDIIEASASIRSPLLRIMEEVQLQDIIRQSIDHVVISLRELKALDGEVAEEAILDELSFIRALPDVCESLIDDIALKIEESLGVLGRETASVQTNINDLENDRTTFVEGALSARDHASLAALLESSSLLFASLIGDLNRSLSRKERIRQENHQLLGEIFQLEKSFRTFETIVSRFRTIDIASRIEVAKQPVLAQNAEAVEEMNRLTRKIESDVDESLSAIKVFIKDTGGTISAYSEHLKNEDNYIRSFEKKARLLHELLNDARNDLVRTLGNFSLYTRKFMQLFETTRGELDTLATLRSDILGLKQTLADIRGQADRALQPRLESRGLKAWKIENAKLKEIIKRFTIFTHKKAAGDIAGFAVEDGASSGELVIF